MSETSVLPCPHCRADVHIPLASYVDDAMISCSTCGRRLRLLRVGIPTHSATKAVTWALAELDDAGSGAPGVSESLGHAE